jgi:acyl dehydratase
MVVGFVLIILCAAVAGLFAWSSHRLVSVLSGAKHVEIMFPPHELRIREVLVAILSMMVKSFTNKFRGSPNISRTDATSENTLSSPFRITEDDIARYQHAVGLPFGSTTELSSSALLLFLSAVTEPAMLLLLSSPRCPINPLGAVNVCNRFELLRPDLCHPKLFMVEEGAGLTAKVQPEPRLVKRGVEYALEVSVMVPDQDNGHSLIPVFRQIFTMLEFRKKRTAAKDSATHREDFSPRTQSSDTSPLRMSFSGNDPLKWAALCKDYNFIHLSGVAAKLFGLPGKLAHGNHVVARAMQALEEVDGGQARVRDLTWMKVQFRRPVVVPASLDVQTQSSGPSSKRVLIGIHSRENVIVEYGALGTQ